MRLIFFFVLLSDRSLVLGTKVGYRHMICMVLFEDETASFVEVEKLAASLRTIPLYSLESLTGLSKLSILMPIQYELSGRYYFVIEVRGKTKQNKQ